MTGGTIQSTRRLAWLIKLRRCIMQRKETGMSLVEEAYWRAVEAMTPEEKFARMHALLNWARDLYARQLREQLGDVSDERIKWEVALRQYGSDRRTRELIERKIRDVQS